MATKRPPRPSSLAASYDEIRTLFLNAKLLDYALEGLVEMVKHSRPGLAWEDELEPFSVLAGDVALTARELYLRVDADVAKRAQEEGG